MGFGDTVFHLLKLAVDDRYRKGWVGETQVNVANWLMLDAAVYRRISNVTLVAADGTTTQIDHVIVSRHGVFVIETKNMSGWIYGKEHGKTWTQNHFGKKTPFQNPLHQNHRHVCVLRELFAIPEQAVHPLIVFIGEAELKTPMPPHVLTGGWIGHIKKRQEVLLSDEEVARIGDAIEEARLNPGRATNARHIASLQTAHEGRETKYVAAILEPVIAPEPRADAVAAGILECAEAPPEPEASAAAVLCPKCGGPMVLRTGKKGKNAGGKFWGCGSYPKCRAVVDVA
ncbi:NERD domain-containing protein [soil metagenome]